RPAPRDRRRPHVSAFRRRRQWIRRPEHHAGALRPGIEHGHRLARGAVALGGPPGVRARARGPDRAARRGWATAGIAGQGGAAMNRVWCGAVLVAAMAASGLAAGQTNGAEVLARLEQAVQAQPDDLRAADAYRMAVIKAANDDRKARVRVTQYDRAL